MLSVEQPLLSWIAIYSSSGDIPGFPMEDSVKGSSIDDGEGYAHPSLRLLHLCVGKIASWAKHGNLTAVFSGELFNAEVLSQTLSLNTTATSTAELICHAYLRWGEDIVLHLRGSYAFLVSDRDKEVLLAARDAMGTTPLYFARVQGDLIFSDSIASMLYHSAIPRTINRVLMAETLCRQWSNNTETYFGAVHRVPPGYLLRHAGGTTRTHQYWNPLPPDAPDDSMTENDLYHFDELLERAVARCVGPNATGVFLSGGLDSVSVAAAAVNYAEAHGLPQPHALSLSFPDPECDEASIQRGVASQLGVSQTLLKFEDAVGPAGLIRCASELSAQLDSPLQNPWWPAYQALAREGKRNDCRIILTGGGGDEWLTTNPNHMADLLSHGDFVGAYHLGRSIHHSYRLPLMRSLRYLMWTAGVRPLLRSRLRKIAPSATEKIGVWRNRSTVPAWIAPDQELRRSVRVRREQMLIASLQRVPPTGRYAYYSDDTISTSLTSSLVSMEHEEDYLVGRRLGLRICRPYWDEDLVDFLRKVPPRLLLSGGRDKGIVRRFVSSRFSGLGFARQQKVSAQRYFYGLLDAEFREVWRGLGGAQRLSELELVDSKRVESAVSESLRDNEIRSKHRAWEILILEAWLRGQTT